MKVDIGGKPHVRFSQIVVGKCFSHDGHTYQRITYQNKKDIAVDLATGQAVTFVQTDIKVLPLSLKVVEDE